MPLLAFALLCLLPHESRLVEAESFDSPGGWRIDTQSIDEMGSAYLIAHGLGRPVDDATTTIELPAGRYTPHVRTKDWVAVWDAPGTPGRFRLTADGETIAAENGSDFGTRGVDWAWHRGQAFEHGGGELTLGLRDLTGFDGRADAIWLTTDDADPPADASRQWRASQQGIASEPIVKDGYDLVVVGGGYSGVAAAISAARMGCRVALVQNRDVLGGNGSSEVRVWAMGFVRRGRYARIGEIVAEFADAATKSPGTYEEFEDDKKLRIVRAEPNIDLYLSTHAISVTRGQPVPVVDAAGREVDQTPIEAVEALNVKTGERLKFRGRLFADCTGHGTIGALAGADSDMTPKGRMGMSNMWRWSEAEEPQSFPETPWALDLTMRDFPYPRDHHGQWFWESGFDKDPLGAAERIRDWNLRAVYGAFNAMKNRDGAKDHANARLDWVAYIGGPRESRRLLGDVVLTEEDIISKRQFPDGFVPSTWSIDLHYPKRRYAEKFPDNPFISKAEMNHSVDKTYGYPVPYRCFYSRNVPNLLMAGRCISVTHEALGTVRVMKTCGMMGEVVGKAASVATARNCTPRDVYRTYLDELVELVELPGAARRESVYDEPSVGDGAMARAPAEGLPPGLLLDEIGGLVVDDREAITTGQWTSGKGLKPFVMYGYRYTAAESGADATFGFTDVPPGRYRVVVASGAHPNRCDRLAVRIGGTDRPLYVIDQRPTLDDPPWASGEHDAVRLGGDASVVIEAADGATGLMHIDAVRLMPVQSREPAAGAED